MLPSIETARLLGIPVRWLVVVAISAVVAWNLSLRWEMLFQHRTELGGVEHNVIHGIQKVMLGKALYEDPERPPFDVIQYTPAYHVLCAAIGKVLGLHGDDARAVFVLSRAVALVLWTLMGWFVFRACRAGGASTWSAVLAAGITLCSTWEQAFSRMDALVGATSAATAWLFIRWLTTGSQRALTATMVVATIGVFAKQSGVVMVAAPLLYLAIAREWQQLRKAMVSLLLTTALCSLGMLSLGSITAIHQNIVLGLRNGFSWMMYTELFNPPTYKYFIGWHVLAVVLAVVGWRARNAPLRFIAIAVPLSLGFAMATGLKYGSRLNYLHESLMLTFIGTTFLIHDHSASTWGRTLAWSFVGYGCLFAAFRTNSVAAWYRMGLPDAPHVEQLQADMAVRDVLINDLGLKPDELILITYREYLEHFFVGQSVLTQKDIVQYSTNALFDYSNLYRAMSDGTVRFVVTDGSIGPVSLLDSTYSGWYPVREVDGRKILGRIARP